MPIRRRAFYYAVGSYTFHDWFASAYEASVSPEYGPVLKQKNPNHQSFGYKSATDTNTVQGSSDPSPGAIHPDAVTYGQMAIAKGLEPEDLYLHWAEPTQVGYLGTLLSYAAGDRVEVYHDGHQNLNRIRHAHNFGPMNPVHIQFWESCLEKNGFQYDGLFLDNAANILLNYGYPLISGGVVTEASARIGSPAFNTWHWGRLKDCVRAWSHAKPLAQNIANYWTDEFADPHVKWLVGESTGNPIHEGFQIPEIYRRHQLAESKGVGYWLSASIDQGTPAETWEEMQYANLCYFLVVRSKTTTHHIQDWTGPKYADWPTRITSPALVETIHLLGEPTGQPPELVPGTNIYLRPYTRGGAFCRIKPWNEPTDSIQNLGPFSNMIWLQPNGVKIKAPPAIPIKNGGGAILLRP